MFRHQIPNVFWLSHQTEISKYYFFDAFSPSICFKFRYTKVSFSVSPLRSKGIIQVPPKPSPLIAPGQFTLSRPRCRHHHGHHHPSLGEAAQAADPSPVLRQINLQPCPSCNPPFKAAKKRISNLRTTLSKCLRSLAT